MIVTIDYFKSTGKFYSHSEYESSCTNMFTVFEEVRDMFARNKRPGLVDGPMEFYAVVDSEDGYPALLIPTTQPATPGRE